jgi:ADP-ribosylglycohydrolase
MDNVNNKIRGSLIGGAIGDALGYQIEFKRNIKDKEVTKYQNDKGIISDDTQMTLFTANALLWRETRFSLRGIAMTPTRAIYESYLDWLDTQDKADNHNSISWIKSIPELNVRRAPGNTCLSSLISGKMGTIEEPINDSKGCGGIMRVAPVGLYSKDSKTAGIIGAESSAITHGHPLGIIPCYILASMLNMIVYNNENIETALDKSIKQYYDDFNKFDKADVDYLIELINKAKKLAKENISDTEAIASLGEGWVAEETFAIAIYSCLKYPNSFQDAIICSVNHDGDSDSTGAVTGNIIGAYLGYDAIPDYYKDNVELKDTILELADDMSIDIPISEYSTNKDEKWESKYLIKHDDNKKKSFLDKLFRK